MNVEYKIIMLFVCNHFTYVTGKHTSYHLRVYKKNTYGSIDNITALRAPIQRSRKMAEEFIVLGLILKMRRLEDLLHEEVEIINLCTFA